MRKTTYGIAGVVLAVFVAPLAAQTASAPKAMADSTFIKQAAEANLAEIELGKLAKQQAADAAVKTFGQRMIDDHMKAQDTLKPVAQKEHIALPTTLDRSDESLKARLSKLSGPAFDRAYMAAMLKDHRTDVSEFRVESKGAKDSDVKTFAAKTLPTLEAHLKLAQDTNKAVATEHARS
jgi:putative membrane protein